MLEVGLHPTGLAPCLSAELAQPLLGPAGELVCLAGNSTGCFAHRLLHSAHRLTYSSLDSLTLLPAFTLPPIRTGVCIACHPVTRDVATGPLRQEPGHSRTYCNHGEWVFADNL